MLDNIEHKNLTRIEIDLTYRYLQVWNEDILVDVVDVTSLTGHINSLLVYYVTTSLYDTIPPNIYMTSINTGMDQTYHSGETMVARDNIKENWVCDISKYGTRNIVQNSVKEMLIKAVPADCLEEKRDQRK